MTSCTPTLASRAHTKSVQILLTPLLTGLVFLHSIFFLLLGNLPLVLRERIRRLRLLRVEIEFRLRENVRHGLQRVAQIHSALNWEPI